MEATMNLLKTGVCAICILGSVLAYAQNNASAPAQTDQRVGQHPSPGVTENNAGSATNAGGGNGSGQNTLMQKREKAMSPEGASGSAGTGKIKQ
jgi:hypothetical protein